MRPHVRREQPETQTVYCVLETRAVSSVVVAVKTSEGAARIAAKVLRQRYPLEDSWRVTVTGPHDVSADYI